VVDFVGTDDPQFAGELLELKTKDELEALGAGGLRNRDELYETAVDIVVRERRGSVSLLQRALGIGYGRAARLIDFMAEDGIVGEYNGSQAREVMISLEDWEAMSQTQQGELVSASGSATIASTNLPGGGLGSRGVGRPSSDDGALATARYAGSSSTATTSPPPRRNRIVPEPDEPSNLEDGSAAPFDEEVDDSDDEWDDDESGELASASGEAEQDSDDEYDEALTDDEDEWEDDEDESDSDAENESDSDAEDDDWEESEEDTWEEEEVTQK
jgi:S-DNA-T family DNA segregation ATPase FtsK/SpoIIIE